MIPKAANTHSEYVIPIAFPLQQWLPEYASSFYYTYVACLVANLAYLDVAKLQWHDILLGFMKDSECIHHLMGGRRKHEVEIGDC
jgi:hypothetical protein